MREYLSNGFLIGSLLLGVGLGLIGAALQLGELPFMILCIAASTAYALLYPVRSKA